MLIHDGSIFMTSIQFISRNSCFIQSQLTGFRPWFIPRCSKEKVFLKGIFSRCWPVQKLNESVWRTQKEKQAESMRRFEPQLFVCFTFLFCSLASCRAKPRLSFGPEGWYNPLDSYFGTLSWSKSEAVPREHGSQEADNLEASSNTPTTNHNQPIRFPGQIKIQPIEFQNQGSTPDIQPIIFPGPTGQKQRNVL